MNPTQYNLVERQALLQLLSLPRLGPARLRWLCADANPSEVIRMLRSGQLPTRQRAPRGVNQDLIGLWSRESRALDSAELWAKYEHAGVSLLFPGDGHWPFGDDPEPPAMLFYQGDIEALSTRTRVGVVGTRRCSALGRRVARGLGYDLTASGVAVVSGLALGIDGAAHTGAVASLGVPPIAVVGTGLDQVYPSGNRLLWEQLACDGLLLSEAPLGAGPERWRFPARNRLLAGLVDLLVVVESHAKGGALLTVGEAADRGIPVAAVPGSVLAKSCEGSNLLLIEGCQPVRHAADILDALGVVSSQAPSQSSTPDPQLSQLEAALVEALAGGSTHVNRLIESIGQPAPAVFAAVQSLVTAGLVRLDGSTALLTHQGPSATSQSLAGVVDR